MPQQRKPNQADEETFEVFTVPTDKPISPPKQLDISRLTNEEFKGLRKSDAFMYYSIPGVLEAANGGRSIEHGDVMALIHHGDAAAGVANDVMVSRKTRISDGGDAITSMTQYFETMQANH
jgi:hypothetical protein